MDYQVVFVGKVCISAAKYVENLEEAGAESFKKTHVMWMNSNLHI